MCDLKLEARQRHPPGAVDARSVRPWHAATASAALRDGRKNGACRVTARQLSLPVCRFAETGDPPVRHRCAHPPRDRPPHSRHPFPLGAGALAQWASPVGAGGSHRARVDGKGVARAVGSQGARLSGATGDQRVIRAMAAPAANARNTDVSGFARTVLRRPCVHSSPISCMR